MRTFPKLVIAVSATCMFSMSAYADPASCDPKMASSPSQESTQTSWFESLFKPAAKPTAFARVIGATRDPDPGCTGGVEAQPVAGNYRNQTVDRSLN